MDVGAAPSRACRARIRLCLMRVVDPLVSVSEVTKRYPGGHAALDEVSLDVPARRGGGGDGPVGQRQVHAAEPDRRAGQADQRHGHRGRAADRRAERDRAGPVPPQPGRDDLPVLQPAGRPDRGRQRAAARPAGRDAAPQGPGPGPGCWPSWASSSTGTPIPGGCPAGSGSGWRSPGRWSTTPAVLLADEPTGAVDTATGEAIGRLLLDLNEAGQTLVLVTHSPELAARYASRVVRLVDGRITSDAVTCSSGRRWGTPVNIAPVLRAASGGITRRLVPDRGGVRGAGRVHRGRPARRDPADQRQRAVLRTRSSRSTAPTWR